MGPGHRIATVICGAWSCSRGFSSLARPPRLPSPSPRLPCTDGAYRYQSRLFSRSWLEQKGLYDYVPEECRYLVTLA